MWKPKLSKLLGLCTGALSVSQHPFFPVRDVPPARTRSHLHMASRFAIRRGGRTNETHAPGTISPLDLDDTPETA